MKRLARTRPAPQAPKRTIPKPHGPGSVSIADGQDVAGSITFADGLHHLFDASDRWLGSYASRAEAMRAAPTVSR